MKFTVAQRMIMHGLIRDSKGDIQTIRDLKRFREDIAITPEEQELLNFQNIGKGVFSWDDSKDSPVEIDVTDRVKKAVETSLAQLSKSGELQLYHLDVYEMFLGENNATKEEGIEEDCPTS